MGALTMIDLLRHGEVQGGSAFRGSTDDPLTDIGLQQMWRATGTKRGWDRVITSPLQRCAGFAEEFAWQRSLPLVVDERLQEMHFGAWEGLPAADIMAHTPDALARFWNDPEQHSAPGGEPLALFRARVLEAWGDITRQYAGERLLLVTHGGVIRVLLSHVQNRPLGKLLEIEVRHGALLSLRIDGSDKRSAALQPLGRG
ncbi:alpha-ribazole phosphatase [Candidatus Tenderia electrophaga]|jgi:broad specificity phosphatase PhoE|uniref:Alpha-ribazole phosphatase n=1 Tax=Candidatus Tenderia electrophaga TaxID=1748243 RepID=A0A0S2TCJ7_9GAMM|nr:alpha-ribazole phosphatase [Candidatus Tenderia electrophaga]